jgi:hypothetical protein
MAVINGPTNGGAWLPGTAGEDTINGFGDFNTLWGGDGINGAPDIGPNFLNILNGGSHNNLVGAAGPDRFNGGTGIDITASYQLSSAPVVASLADPSRNTGDAAGDTYVNIYQLTGSPHGGALYGDTTGKANQLWALGGTNDLFGATGYTVFISGPGADHMVGGAGRGMVDYETSQSAVTASLRDFSINSGEAAGDSYSNIWDLAGSQYADTLYGDDNNNNMLGGHSNDRGGDTFYGFGGSDTFTGLRGADVMYGGTGTDLFVFTADDIVDAQNGLLNRVGDYNYAESDQIDLGSLGVSSSSVRIMEDNSNTFATVDANVGGTWLKLARLDGLHTGDAVHVNLPSSVTLTVQAGGSSAASNSDVGSHGAAWPISGVGDFNGDGTSDVLWRNPSTGQVDQWQMQGGRWSKSIDLGATKPANWQLAGVGDFDGDGTSDVVWRDISNSQVDQWHMKNGNWAGSIDLGKTKGADWTLAGVGDFNGDGTSDILWRKIDTSQVDQWEMKNGNWSKSMDLGATKGSDWTLAGVGDFNGDGTSDVLWRNVKTSQVDQWEMKNGNWSKSIDLGATKGSDWQVAGIGDFNGDHTSDIMWFNKQTGQTEHWVMSGGNWAGSVNDGTQDKKLQPAGVGDFNHDGKADALWLDAAAAHVYEWML